MPRPAAEYLTMLEPRVYHFNLPQFRKSAFDYQSALSKSILPQLGNTPRGASELITQVMATAMRIGLDYPEFAETYTVALNEVLGGQIVRNADEFVASVGDSPPRKRLLRP